MIKAVRAGVMAAVGGLAMLGVPAVSQNITSEQIRAIGLEAALAAVTQGIREDLQENPNGPFYDARSDMDSVHIYAEHMDGSMEYALYAMQGIKNRFCGEADHQILMDAGARFVFHIAPIGSRTVTQSYTLDWTVCRDANAFTIAELSLSEFEQILVRHPISGPILNAMLMYFPEYAYEMLSRAHGEARQGRSEAYVGQILATELAAFRVRNAHYILSAPDHIVTGTLMMMYDMHAALRHDPRNCNQLTVFGAPSLEPEPFDLVIEQVADGGLVVEAIEAGMNRPIHRRDATDDDYLIMWEIFFQNGGTDEQLDAIIDPDVSDPALCDGMLNLLTALVEVPGEQGEIVRSSFLAESSMY